MADFHMTKEALSWICGLRRNNLLTTWEKFVENLKERYEELSWIQHTSTVAEYMGRFEILLNEVEGQNEETHHSLWVDSNQISRIN